MLSLGFLIVFLVLCPLITSAGHPEISAVPSLPVLACVTVGYTDKPRCARGVYRPSNLTERICAPMIAAMDGGAVFTCMSNLKDYCQFPSPTSTGYASLLITGSSDELHLVLDTNCQFPLNTLIVGTYPCFKQLGGRSISIPSSIFGQIYQGATTETFSLISGLIPGLCSQMMKIPN